ncbi:hypothetical protein [Mycolicibacterium sp.]|uniref:hypothetical protein n=1 Tax=Mycolicibacterium sp. TaxID=2320850 RepID=UPI00355E7E1E
MTDSGAAAGENPYGEKYMEELRSLVEAQTAAAETFAAQTLLLRIGHTGASPTTRERLAEEAAQTWIAAYTAISELNSREYRKNAAAQET